MKTQEVSVNVLELIELKTRLGNLKGFTEERQDVFGKQTQKDIKKYEEILDLAIETREVKAIKRGDSDDVKALKKWLVEPEFAQGLLATLRA